MGLAERVFESCFTFVDEVGFLLELVLVAAGQGCDFGVGAAVGGEAGEDVVREITWGAT